MDVADDIAFGIHDLEDALALRLMDEEDIRKLVPEAACACFLDALKKRYHEEFGNDVYDGFVRALAGELNSRKRFINLIVHHLITKCRIETDKEFTEPLLRYSVQLPKAQATFLSVLKDAVVTRVIRSASVQQLEFKGQNMVVAVYEALASDPDSLLPEPTLQRYHAADDSVRVICDYLAGMTDAFLLKTYDRLFSPRLGSVFDRL